MKDAIQLAVSIFNMKNLLQVPAEVVSQSPPCPADAEYFPFAQARGIFWLPLPSPSHMLFEFPSLNSVTATYTASSDQVRIYIGVYLEEWGLGSLAAGQLLESYFIITKI